MQAESRCFRLASELGAYLYLIDDIGDFYMEAAMFLACNMSIGRLPYLPVNITGKTLDKGAFSTIIYLLLQQNRFANVSVSPIWRTITLKHPLKSSGTKNYAIWNLLARFYVEQFQTNIINTIKIRLATITFIWSGICFQNRHIIFRRRNLDLSIFKIFLICCE